MLHTIDEDWKEHLREMDELRQSVQNASYEQKDPLLIYKLESFNLFKLMVNDINSKSVSILMRGQIPIRDSDNVRQAAPEQKTDYSKYRTQKDEAQEPHRPTERQGNPNNENWNRYAWRRKWEETSHVLAEAEKFKNCHGRGA